MIRIEILLDNYVEEDHRSECKNFIKKNERLFNTSKGSAIKHQAWPGGYRDHITEVMNIAKVTYEALATVRPLPFTLSDALVGCFLHDIEKIWKHALDPEDRADVLKETYLPKHFSMSPALMNVIKYAHGEGDDYHPINRVQWPLAAFVHHCDNTSARIWFDFPRPEERSLNSESPAYVLMERYNLSVDDITEMDQDLKRRLYEFAKKRGTL